MSEAELRSELEELRRALEELRAAPSPAAPRARAASDAGRELAEGARRAAEALDLDALTSRLTRGLGVLADDFGESRPRALVAAFLAGVAVGKLMSR